MGELYYMFENSPMIDCIIKYELGVNFGVGTDTPTDIRTHRNSMTLPGLGAGPSENKTNPLTCEWLQILSYAFSNPCQWLPAPATGCQPQPVDANSNKDLLVPQLLAAAPAIC